ncbi:MAG: hypothetical protein JRN19_07285 [Nitrososphaerota archaeon]|nr:hypothetical protein [Nitrososphaerota archaeon]MDG7049134.1 hypothetical protein [Nitrososphaerota archaeon]MDG7052232.1 hypothetical protein [Nitrososphaerota archaeon]
MYSNNRTLPEDLLTINGIESVIQLMAKRARGASQLPKVVIVILVVAAAGASVFAYETSAGAPFSTYRTVVQVDYLAMPVGATGATWGYTIVNAGKVEITSVNATLLVGSNAMTQEALSIAPGHNDSGGYSGIAGVQPGGSYPVNFTVLYANGRTQVITALVTPFAHEAQSNTAQATVMYNGLIFVPSSKYATWTFAVGNAGTETIVNVTVTVQIYFAGFYGLEISQASAYNITPGDVWMHSNGLPLSTNKPSDSSFKANLTITYANGQTIEVSTPVNYSF